MSGKKVRALASIALCATLAACSGGFATVAPRPPATYQSLGHAEGKACGTMLLLATAYNAIPVMLNDRVDRAYARAIASVPGATALTKVTLKEEWYWWVIGTLRCTTISGEAVQ